jgi:hypothetical protein
MNKREFAAKQAIASVCIEGFEPNANFMDDWEKLVKEEIFIDEFSRRTHERALRNEEIKYGTN